VECAATKIEPISIQVAAISLYSYEDGCHYKYDRAVGRIGREKYPNEPNL